MSDEIKINDRVKVIASFYDYRIGKVGKAVEVGGRDDNITVETFDGEVMVEDKTNLEKLYDKPEYEVGDTVYFYQNEWKIEYITMKKEVDNRQEYKYLLFDEEGEGYNNYTWVEERDVIYYNKIMLHTLNDVEYYLGELYQNGDHSVGQLLSDYSNELEKIKRMIEED